MEEVKELINEIVGNKASLIEVTPDKDPHVKYFIDGKPKYVFKADNNSDSTSIYYYSDSMEFPDNFKNKLELEYKNLGISLGFSQILALVVTADSEEVGINIQL